MIEAFFKGAAHLKLSAKLRSLNALGRIEDHLPPFQEVATNFNAVGLQGTSLLWAAFHVIVEETNFLQVLTHHILHDVWNCGHFFMTAGAHAATPRRGGPRRGENA